MKNLNTTTQCELYVKMRNYTFPELDFFDISVENTDPEDAAQIIAESLSEKTLWDFAISTGLIALIAEDQHDIISVFNGEVSIEEKEKVLERINNDVDPLSDYYMLEEDLRNTVAVFFDRYQNEEYWDTLAGWKGSVEYSFEYPMELAHLLESEGRKIIPIYGYSHSGLLFSTDPFSCPFDSGIAGYAVIDGNSEESMGELQHYLNFLNNEEEFEEFL